MKTLDLEAGAPAGEDAKDRVDVHHLSRQLPRIRIRTALICAMVGLLAFIVNGRGGGGSRSAAGQCRGLVHLAQAAQKFSTFLTASNPDLDTFGDEFHDFAAFRVLRLRGVAPDEIRADMNVLAAAVSKYEDAFSKYVDAVANLDLANLNQKTLEKLAHPSIAIDRKRVMQASQNIAAWVPRAQKRCVHANER